MNIKTLLSTLLFLSHISLTAQIQIGEDIDGETVGDQFGSSVALSADGNILAVGATHNDGDGDAYSSGHVRVFQFSNNQWIQIGSDIDGEGNVDFSGWSIALSSDGNILAIGATHNDGNGFDTGHVRVFQFSNNQWSQIGNDINGEEQFDFSGRSIDLSADGTILAVSAKSNDDNGMNSGHVRVFHFTNNEWTQIGNDISGEAPEDGSGASISLSADGNILAIGATGNDGDGTVSNSGHARVFQFSNNQWTQIGNDIDGDAIEDQFGSSLELSADGNILAVGARFNNGNGNVKVFQLSNNQWSQIGNNIEGEPLSDWLSTYTALSADGNILAIGVTFYDGNSYLRRVKIFQFNNNQWIQIGNDIDGEQMNNVFGKSITLSSDGNILAVGGNNNDENGNETGHVSVFQITNPNLSSNDICFTLEHNPAESYYILEGDITNCNIFILDENENVVQFLLNFNDKIIINLEELPAGLHFIRVEHQQEDDLFVQEIIKQ